MTLSLLQKEGAKPLLFPEEMERILSSHYNHWNINKISPTARESLKSSDFTT